MDASVGGAAGPLSLADIREEAIRLHAEGVPVREIAPELIRRGLDPEAIDEAIAQGVAEIIRHAIQNHYGAKAAENGLESDTRSGRLHPIRHHAKEYWQRILARPYEGADGVPRPLLQFSLADAQAFRERVAAMADGLLRQKAAMELAETLLTRHQKSRIGDLPEKAQREIAEAWA